MHTGNNQCDSQKHLGEYVFTYIEITGYHSVLIALPMDPSSCHCKQCQHPTLSLKSLFERLTFASSPSRKPESPSLQLTQTQRAVEDILYLDKLLNGLCDISIELFDLYSSEVHVAEQTVDDLEERLLHTGKPLFQQLIRGEIHSVSEKAQNRLIFLRGVKTIEKHQHEPLTSQTLSPFTETIHQSCYPRI